MIVFRMIWICSFKILTKKQIRWYCYVEGVGIGRGTEKVNNYLINNRKSHQEVGEANHRQQVALHNTLRDERSKGCLIDL